MKIIKRVNIVLNRIVNNFDRADYRQYSSEIQFWENHLAKNDEFKDGLETLLDKKTRKKAFPKLLENMIIDLNKEFKNQKLKLLEIGSGPTSNLAWGVDNNMFRITAIDPLADIYNKLMKKYGYNFPIKPIKCTGENMSKLFEEESFHVVFSQNAIDHSVSPKHCILNMYKVLKEGGIMYLCGNIREGTNQKWYGLHQHNLDPIDDQLIHFDKNGLSSNLTDGLMMKAIYSYRTGNIPGSQYIIVYKKFLD